MGKISDLCNLNSRFEFININKKNQDRIFKLLNNCKEIRDTLYPLKDSSVTELHFTKFSARKEQKDLINVNGMIELVDGENIENRSFEAYIIDNQDEVHIYMDITRLNAMDEPKMIRTSESIIEKRNSIIIITKYSSSYSSEEKIFSNELVLRDDYLEYYLNENEQLSAL